jgi:hypothetical protein
MSEKTDENENAAAYPIQGFEFGMTKREEIAKAAMQGILSNTHDWTPEFVAEKAVTLADALLRRLEKP